MFFIKSFSECRNLCSPPLKISFFEPSLANLCKGIRFQQSCVSERRPLQKKWRVLLFNLIKKYELYTMSRVLHHEMTKWRIHPFDHRVNHGV